MRQLFLMLYPEGRTDARALPILLERVARRIIGEHGTALVEVFPVEVAKGSKEEKAQDRNVLAAARQAAGRHALAVHCDADTSAERAFDERYVPGRDLVEEAAEGEADVCRRLFPVIPVRMTESWMLADAEVLADVIGTSVSPENLGLPDAGKVESVTDPKGRLKSVISRAVSSRRRRRKIDIGELYDPVARRIRLGRLEKVDSFMRLKSDLTEVLRDLHMVEP